MFDAYHKWLGIPRDQRPPTYYQLLGIAADEQDRDVIEEAVIRQTAHIRNYQTGPQAVECTRLLNEIAEARATLTNPGKRKRYDQLLAQKNAVPRKPQPAPATAPFPVAATDPPAPPELEAFAFTSAPSVRTAPRPPRKPARGRSRAWRKPALIVLAAVVFFGGLAALIWAIVYQPSRSDRSERGATTLHSSLS